MISLKQELGGLVYDGPLVVSSSPATDSVELIKRAEENGAAAVSTKLTLLHQATKGTRLMYGERGLYGFNPSDKRNDLEDGLRLVRQAKEATNLVIWSNISGFGGDLESWVTIAKAFEQAGADALELNLMCPNFAHSPGKDNCHSSQRVGGVVGKDPVMIEQIVGKLKASVKIPIWCKPATEVADYAVTALAVQNAGGDGLVTSAAQPVAPPIDIYRGGRPKMATMKTCSFGGLTGPAIRQASYRYIATAARAVKIPIAGGGGIETAEHAIEAIMFGSSLVTICTKILWDGFPVLKDIRQGLIRFMDENGYETVDQMRGLALQYLVTNDKIETQPSYAVINTPKCSGCGICARIGSCSAITIVDKKAAVDSRSCCGCGLCASLCPSKSITFNPVTQ